MLYRLAVGALALVGALLSSPASAATPSFDCASADATVDRLICANSWLSDLDGKMAVAFRAVLHRSGSQRKTTLEEQREWLQSRRLTCELPAAEIVLQPALARANLCLGLVYQARVGELNARLRAASASNPRDVSVFQATATDALQWAARAGDLATAKRLIALGADVKVGLPLYSAAFADNLPMVELLIEAGADPNAIVVLHHETGRASTPLRVAAELKHQDIMNFLLDHGGDVGVEVKSGTTSLMIAAMTGRPTIVADVLDSKPALNAHADFLFFNDRAGKTALMIAAERGFRDVVRLLLGAGANPNASSRNGMTALHSAAWSAKDVEIVELLIAHGADLNAKGQEIGTPITQALDVEVARVLLDAGADVNDVSDSDGRTLLHWAALNCDRKLITFLLEHGADPLALNRWGQTPRAGADAMEGRKCRSTTWPPALASP